MKDLRMYLLIAALLFFSGVVMFINGTEYVDRAMAASLLFMGAVFVRLYVTKRRDEEND